MTTEKKELANVSNQLAPLVQMAMSGDMDAGKLDQLEKLYEMQKQFEADQARKAYYKSLENFKATVPDITKNAQGHNSKYAKLDHALKIIKPFLKENNLSLTWRTDTTQGIKVTAVLTHVDGYSEETTLSAPADKSGNKNDVQSIGSTVSYLQRYTAFPLLGLAATEDDDAQKSAQPKQENPLIVEARNLFAEVKAAGASKEQLAELEGLMKKLDVPEFTKQAGFMLAELKGEVG